MSTPVYDEVANGNVTTDERGTPTLAPNNKVQKGILAGAALTVLVAVLSAVTPDMLSFAGQLTPLLIAGVTALVTLGTTYLAKPLG